MMMSTWKYGPRWLLTSADSRLLPVTQLTLSWPAHATMSVGTPVVAYDIDCLREVVPAEGGLLVPTAGGFDARAYADALVEVWHDEPRCAVVARRGPDLARIHDWDALAATQDAFYRRVVAEGRGGA